MIIFNIIYILALVIVFGVGVFLLFREIKKQQKLNVGIIERNKKEKILNDLLAKEIAERTKDRDKLNETIHQLEDSIKIKKLQEKQNEYLLCQQARDAFEKYVDVLEEDYKKQNFIYNDRINKLQQDFKQEQQALGNKLDKYKEDIQIAIEEEKEKIQNIKAFRQAAQQAITREKEIKEKQNFYCLAIDEKDKNDIAILEKIKPQLTKPRVLSMLIWSTWFQKPMTALCNNILGTQQVTGIYKITNIITNECYVGQAIDVASRLKTHAKCGLGIDTPAGNKLYKAMQEYGIWNFSWELLEQCDKSQLNERERYYIDLYMSKDYGYNSNKGVNI